jgi:hypothetical protein
MAHADGFEETDSQEDGIFTIEEFGTNPPI